MVVRSSKPKVHLLKFTILLFVTTYFSISRPPRDPRPLSFVYVVNVCCPLYSFEIRSFRTTRPRDTAAAAAAAAVAVEEERLYTVI